MKVSDDEILQAIFAELGCIVMRATEEYRCGHIVPNLFSDEDRPIQTAQRFYVIREATEEEFEQQKAIIRRFGKVPESRLPGQRFYRLGTD